MAINRRMYLFVSAMLVADKSDLENGVKHHQNKVNMFLAELADFSEIEIELQTDQIHDEGVYLILSERIVLQMPSTLNTDIDVLHQSIVAAFREEDEDDEDDDEFDGDEDDENFEDYLEK
jgi:hypothetical protein